MVRKKSSVPGSRSLADAQRIEGAIDALPSEELCRLLDYGDALTTGSPFASGALLFDSALERIRAGSRVWPDDVPFEVFLKNVIRSIASEWRKRGDATELRDDVVDTHVQVETPEHALLRAEGELESERAYDLVIETCGDDGDLLQLVVVLEAGLNGEEAASECGWTRRKFDTVRRRFRRRLEHHGLTERPS